MTVRRRGELVAVMPMEARRGELCAPVNWHSPMFAPVAVDAAAEREVLALCFGEAQARVDLNLLCGARVSLQDVVDAARRERRMVHAQTVARSPFVVTEGSHEAYEQTLSRNRRKALRRHRRRLEGLGEVRFEIHDGDADLERVLAELYTVEASGWKGRRGTAIASRPDTASFYSAVAHWAASRGWLRLAFLRLDDRPVACDFALEHDGTWYSLKAGYDEALRSFGAGALLLRETISHCFREDVSRLHLLGTADAFKLSWTRDYEERFRVGAYRRTPGGAAGLTGRLGRAAARRSRQALTRQHSPTHRPGLH
jgi:CelD/BcsL family acetyltransferase involved in cellulose biosynthesis